MSWTRPSPQPNSMRRVYAIPQSRFPVAPFTDRCVAICASRVDRRQSSPAAFPYIRQGISEDHRRSSNSNPDRTFPKGPSIPWSSCMVGIQHGNNSRPRENSIWLYFLGPRKRTRCFLSKMQVLRTPAPVLKSRLSLRGFRLRTLLLSPRSRMP